MEKPSVPDVNAAAPRTEEKPLDPGGMTLLTDALAYHIEDAWKRYQQSDDLLPPSPSGTQPPPSLGGTPPPSFSRPPATRPGAPSVSRGKLR